MKKPTIFEKPSEPIAGKAYVYDQIMDWILAKKVLDFSSMTNIAKAGRRDLEAQYTLNTLSVMNIARDADGTTKFLFELQAAEPPVEGDDRPDDRPGGAPDDQPGGAPDEQPPASAEALEVGVVEPAASPGAPHFSKVDEPS